MKIILAAMAAVIVMLVVALAAALMDKPDVVVRELPTRLAPNARPAYTGNEHTQRQPRNIEYRELPPVLVDIEGTKEALEKKKLIDDAYWECFGKPKFRWDFVWDKCIPR